MDAFFASVEQRDDPRLRGRPVVVGGRSARGVVAAASYEARRYGVRSAMPSVQARKLCPDAVFVRGDMRKYARESGRIFEIFRRFTPLVERLSLDEAFLDLTGTERLLGPPDAAVERLRREVRAETGLAVSAGVAPVKLVAKIASDAAKPDGVLCVAPAQVRAFLDPLPVGRIWGIGPVARARLQACGIETIGELARCDDARLRELLGSWGLEAARLARGEDAREVEPYREPKSYGEENTFADDVSDPRRLEGVIRAHAEAVARRLRRDGVRGRCVTLKLKLARRLGAGRYPLRTRSTTRPLATDDAAEIASAARELLRRAGMDTPVRLVGVAVSRLEAAADAQLDLFEAGSEARGRRSRLNRVVDQINQRFGEDSMVRASAESVERAALSLQIKRGRE
ncbi:MAG: DNA polymerase IV [Proteobacteria bacterium]|nr:DNA polymerase IV [Pseudomonadota bacterium]